MNVAQTILNQLGNRRFVVMTGAKELVGDENSLRMKLPRNPKKVCRVKITLDASDTYSILTSTTQHGKGFEFKQAATDVYAEQLEEMFTAITGLYTRF